MRRGIQAPEFSSGDSPLSVQALSSHKSALPELGLGTRDGHGRVPLTHKLLL